MLDRVTEFRHGYPAHEDDDLSSAIESLEARVARLERQISEESSAFLASMMHGVLAEVKSELDGLKAEWAARIGR
jgi:outer membrane murein-binding lipoprotein Lpp